MEAGGRYFPRGTNVLLCTVGGEFYDTISSMSSEEVLEEMFSVLRNMYGHRAVRPEEIFIPDWASNPLFLGTWATRPLDMEHLTHHLQAPLGRLYFAGEAFSQQYYGNLHGALDRSVNSHTDMTIIVTINNDNDNNDNNNNDNDNDCQ